MNGGMKIQRAFVVVVLTPLNNFLKVSIMSYFFIFFTKFPKLKEGYRPLVAEH